MNFERSGSSIRESKASLLQATQEESSSDTATVPPDDAVQVVINHIDGKEHL